MATVKAARVPQAHLDVRPDDMPESSEHLETMIWHPDAIMDGDLLMYLRAARSMAAFVGWCDGGSTDDGCAAASMDETTINSLHMLHQHNYDTGKALQALVKIINPKSVDKRWSDDDAKKFVRGLKQHGKNFFKIRRDLLPYKETAQLVEYYYLWKKTPAASTTRPHRRHRRPATAAKRQAPTPTLPCEDVEDLSSASEASENESDEECDQPQLASYTCYHCHSTKSEHWFDIGKDNTYACNDCRPFLGTINKTTLPDEITEPPYMFRPVKEEAEWKHSTPDLEKLESEGKECSSCPETSDEGRPEERTSPSTGSTCSSTGSIAKDIASACLANNNGTSDTNSVDAAAKATLDSNPTENNSDEKKVQAPSPTGSFSDGSSGYGAENDDRDNGHMGESDAEHNNQDELGSVLSSNVPSRPESRTKIVSAVSKMESTEEDAEREAARMAEWNCGKTLTGAHHQEEIKQEIKTDKSLIDGRPPMDSMSWYDRFPTEDLTLKRSPHRTVAKDLEYGEELPLRIKQESQLKEEQERMEQPRQMQLQPHPFPLPQQWQPSDSKVKDEIKPQRAIASVAPTPLSKHEGCADQQDVSPNFQGLPPPSLVPLGLAPAAMSVALSDASPPVLRQSPLPSSYVGGVTDVNMMSTSQSRYLAESRPIPHNPEAIRSPISVQVQPDRSRSGSPRTRRDSDSDIEMRQSPSPEPQPEPQKCNEEVHSSSNAIFFKRWNRGSNTCSRCDFEFKPAPNSKMVAKREEKLSKSSHSSTSGKPSNSGSSSSNNNTGERGGGGGGGGTSVLKDGRKMESRKEEEKKKPVTPPVNRTSDAQITSSLMGSHHMSAYGGPERLTPRGGPFPGHDPTPALSQLSAYARPHIGAASRDLQRCMPYGLPPQAIDPYYRVQGVPGVPGVFPPGSREAMELEMERDKHAWDRDMREREMREMEFMEKLKQEIDMKSGGFDRMQHLSGTPLDPFMADAQRRYGGPLGLQAGSGGPPPGHMPGVYQSTNLTVELMQRERERLERMEMMRSNQEQLAAVAAANARDNSALFQLYQRYAQDPAMLQRQLNTYLAMSSASKAHENEMARMMEASHLVYHFAKADPLAAAGSGASAGAPSGLPPSHLPPAHSIPQGHPLYAFAREQERMYLELVNRPPYSTDPILAQQLTVQAAAQQEAIQRQLAMERDCGLGVPPGSMLLH